MFGVCFGDQLTGCASRSQPQGRDFTSRAAQSATAQTLPGTLKTDLINHDADDGDSLCLMAAKIVSGTEIVTVCNISLFQSPLRCYHQTPCLHRTPLYDSVFRHCTFRSVDAFVMISTITTMMMSSLLVADLLKLAIEISHGAYELYSI